MSRPNSFPGHCSQCGDTRIVFDARLGEEVCSRCGLVVTEETLNAGPEWRAFNCEERASRARASLSSSNNLFEMGLMTDFNGRKDGRGNRLDAETMNKMNRLRRYDSRSKMNDTWLRNLSIAMAELDRMADEIHIPISVKEHAAMIYRKALRRDLIRGRSIEAFVAASIYAACRLGRIPRSMKAISERSTRGYEEVSRSYRLLLLELKIKMPVDDPFKFVSGIASKLNVRLDTERYAIEILRKAREMRALSGKEPRGLAAAALYMACVQKKEKRIQKVVAAAADTTEVTLRNRMRGLLPALHNLNY